MADIEIKTEACGMRAYSRINAPHNWNPPPLNPCHCGGDYSSRWTALCGHICTKCGSTCNGACTQPAACGAA